MRREKRNLPFMRGNTAVAKNRERDFLERTGILNNQQSRSNKSGKEDKGKKPNAEKIQ